MIRLGDLLNEILDERLGVPEGILDAAEDTYNTIVEALSGNQILADRTEDRPNIELELEGDYKISDYSFGKIIVNLGSGPMHPGATEKVDWRGMSFSFEAELGEDYKKLKVISDFLTVKLDINFESTSDSTWQDVLDFFQGPMKPEMISSIAHELKHAYDITKQTRTVKGSIQYRTLQPGVGLPALDEFLYRIYYTAAIENSVRATELASFLKAKNVDKKDFLKALQDTRVYKSLKDAENVSYDRMIETMLSNPRYTEVITNWFKSNTPINPDTLTDEEKIKKFLNNWFIAKKDEMKIQFRATMLKKPMHFFQFFGFPQGSIKPEQEKAINDFDKEVNAFKDAESFFRYQEKQVKVEASKALRKLAKLYAYL
jgi:hypothetical protein